MQLIHSVIQDVINTELEILRLGMIKIYEEEGIRASGNYADELEMELSGGFKLKILGPKYAGAIEGGISASNHRWGPVKAIERWIEQKQNLPSIFKEKKDQLKFAIAKKIANEGIQVPNEFNKGKVVSRAIDEFIQIGVGRLIEKIGIEYIPIIRSEMINTLRAA